VTAGKADRGPQLGAGELKIGHKDYRQG